MRAMLEIAQCYLKIKSYSLAREWALKVIAEDERVAEAYNVMGHVAVSSGKWAEARAWFTHTTLVPNPPVQWFNYKWPRTVEPWEWMAICAWNTGDHENARSYHAKAKSFWPDHPWLKTNDKWFS